MRALGPLKDKREALEGALSPRHPLTLKAAPRHIRSLEEERAALDRYLIEAMPPYAWAWQLLQTLPGIEGISAPMILIESSEDLTRFGTAERLASWAALCPGNPESAGKGKSEKRCHGNPIGRYLLGEIANAARRTNSALRAKYDSLLPRRGHKKALIARAHTLLRTLFFVLTQRQPYRDSGLDYEAASVAKNAPRWIRALQKFGYWPAVQPAAV